MSSKMDPVDGGEGAPPTKPKVEGGYQQRYHDLRRENKILSTIIPERVTFSGLTEDLKDHIYDVITGSQADQFTTTTRALASYARRKCSNTQDILITVERQKDVAIPIPTSITDIDMEVAKLLLGKKIGAYVKRIQKYRQNKAKIYYVALGK